jgi:phosphate transport system protein
LNTEPDGRTSFHVALSLAESQVAGLITDVVSSLADANLAVVTGDPAVAADLSGRDVVAGERADDLERLLQVQLARFSPMGRDLRLVLTALRLAPELKRSVDLARHIADRAGLVAGLPTSVQSIVQQMGSEALDMWQQVTQAWNRRDAGAAERLERVDDRLDDLSERLREAAADEHLEVATAIQLNLVDRFYERLGDHAVHVAARIRWLVSGQ